MGTTSCRACPACRPTENCCKPDPVRVRRTAEDEKALGDASETARIAEELNKANQLIAAGAGPEGDGFTSVGEYIFYRRLTEFYANERNQGGAKTKNGTTPAPPLHPPPPRSIAHGALRRSLMNGELKQDDAPIIQNGVPILPILQTIDLTPAKGPCLMGSGGSEASVPSSLKYPQSLQELQTEKAKAVEDRLTAEVRALEEQHKQLRNWHRKEAGDLTNGRASDGSPDKTKSKRAFSDIGEGRRNRMLESPAVETKITPMSRKRSSNTSLSTLLREDEDAMDAPSSGERQNKRPKSRAGKSESPNTITRGINSFRFEESPESKTKPSNKRKFLNDIMTDPNNFVDEINVWNWELRVQDPQNRFEPEEHMFVCSNHKVGLVRSAYARQKNKCASQVRFYAKEEEKLLELDDSQELQHYGFIRRHKTVLAIIDVAN